MQQIKNGATSRVAPLIHELAQGGELARADAPAHRLASAKQTDFTSS
jgi:hypothetical protein